MRVDNVTRGEFDALLKTVRQMQHATPLNNSGMGRGELYVDGGTITIANGGTMNITGLLKGVGQFLWDGIVTLTSTFTANGPWKLNGTGTITGDSTQTGNMTVNGGGQIVVDGSNAMTLGVVGSYPGVSFATGGQVRGYADGLQISAGGIGGTLRLLASGAEIYGGGLIVYGPLYASSEASFNGVTINGVTTVDKSKTVASGTVSNAYIDPATGQLKRIL